MKMHFRLVLLQFLLLVSVQLSVAEENQNNDNGGQQQGDQNDQNKEDLKCDGVTDIECPIKLMKRAWHKVKKIGTMLCPMCDQPMHTSFNPTENWNNMMGGGKDGEKTDPGSNVESTGFDPKGNFEKEMGGDKNN